MVVAFSWLGSVRGFLAAASLFFVLLGVASAEPEKPFTPWMSLSELNAYMEKLDGDKPEGKNFWDRGNWISGVEGRWEAGIPQYRISHNPVPARRAHWWMWFINQDQKSFDKQVHDLADDGYTLVHFNSYVRPGGGERFQGVWQKLVPLTGAAPLPAGTYRLSAIEGNPYTGSAITAVIEETRISGQSLSCRFKGSVRDRFSGSMEIIRLGERPSSELTRQESQAERALLAGLENAVWDEEKEGRLRVVKNGKTVLRFDREQNAVEAGSAR
jgi:hypothetical protein